MSTAQAQEAAPDGGAGLPHVEQRVRDQLAAGGAASFWVYLRDGAELGPAARIAERGAQGRFVYDELRQTASASQADLRAMLDAAGASYESFWIANTIRVRGDAELLERITARPEVAQVTADRVYELPEPIRSPAEAEATVDGNVEWNIDRVRAPQVWETFGVTGEGIVVGTIDSGAQFDHPALVSQYRGTQPGGSFDHNYHWHDPSGVCGSPSLTPCDNVGHGTHVVGTIVGDDGGANRIGVAPGAQWIAAKGCEGRSCSQSALLSSGQFMLAPTDLRGENADPQRRPHIVNNSWGGEATTDPWYRPTVQAWLAAGIFPQFAAGNTSPGVAPCGSAGNPGNLPEAYAAGGFDINNEIGDYSNRGPSAWDDDLVKPDLAAPGTNVRSSVPGGGYAPDTGTSMASPHVAGAVALLWSAAEALVRDIDATRDLLDRTAIDVEDLTCGGEPANNNVWGQGRLDVLTAVEDAPRGPAGLLAGTVSDVDSGDPLAGATITVSGVEDRERIAGADGTYAIPLPVGEYAVTASAFGYQPRTTQVTITDGETTNRDFPLAPVDLVTVSGRITDGSGHGWPMYARVDVPGTPVRTFTDPETGRYSLALPIGDTYQVRVEPQYPGYAGTTADVEVGDGDVTLDLTSVAEACAQAPGYGPGQPGEPCQPLPGGLVVGHVTDANTGDPVNGAQVASVDNPDESGPSSATPEDPALDDGFYWLFSSRTGAAPITATAGAYADETRTVTVVADGTTPASFALPAGQLVIDRGEIEAELRLGESAARTFTITNTGTAPARVELGQLPGSFEVLGARSPARPGKPWRAPTSLVPNPDYDPDSPTAEGRYLTGPQPDATPHAAGDIITSWRPAGMGQAWGVGFDGDVWLSDVIAVENHEFTVDGRATGVSHPAAWAGAWAADLAQRGEDEMCQVNAGGDNGIYCWDTGTGDVSRTITGPFPWTSTSQRGLGYRADDDTFYIGGWNQDVLYQVRGFSHETPGEVVHQCSFPGMGISGLAWNPTAELIWVATNSATDDIHLVDPDQCAVLDTLGHPTPGYNGGGLHLNDEGDLWMVSQDSSGAENAAYLVESGVPDLTDLPWLELNPAAATLDPGDTMPVTAAMDSGATDQGQPGTYTAGVHVGHDTPYEMDTVEVAMVATPPRTWGLVSGTVTAIGCAGEQRAPFGATVRIDGRHDSAALRADAGGGYAYWMSARNNPVDVAASARGYRLHSDTAVVAPKRETVVDLSLRRTDEFGYSCGPDEADFAEGDTVLPVTGRRAMSTIDLPFPFPFYGQTYTRANVCGNGYVEFAGPATSFPIGCSFGNARLPTQVRPNAAIYPYWDENLLIDAEASVRTGAQGSTPDRRLVIEFRNVRYFDIDDPAQRIDFNVVLHENGDVLTQYRNIDGSVREQGGSAVLGIEDHTGTVALQYAYHEPVLAAGPDGTSIRYQPPPPVVETPAESWASHYGGPGPGNDTARATRVSPDGTQVFVTGTSPGDGTGNDYATIAYDTATGDQLWQARYDGPTSGGDQAYDLAVSPDGTRVFVTGASPGDGTGNDYATIAYDTATGDQLWQARYDGPTNGGDEAYAIGVSPDGTHVFVTGRSIGDATSFDYATVAYEAATGQQTWAARYDGTQPSYGLDQAFALGISPDGGSVYVTGQSRGDGTGYDYATVAYDTATGDESWVSRYNGPSGDGDVARAVGVSPDGSQVYVTGQSEGSGGGYATVAYEAATGQQTWVSRYGTGTDIAWALGISPDGGSVYVTGQSRGDGTGNDYATVAYDTATGDEAWTARHHGPGGADVASALGVSPDGTQVFVTGHSEGSVGTGAAFATVFYDAATGVELRNIRYNGPITGDDTARALAVSPDGARVYVSGDTPDDTGGREYATVAYDTVGSG